MPRQNLDTLTNHLQVILDKTDTPEKRDRLRGMRDTIDKALDLRTNDGIKAAQYTGAVTGATLCGAAAYFAASAITSALEITESTAKNIQLSSASVGTIGGAFAGYRGMHELMRGCTSEDLKTLKRQIDQQLECLSERLRQQIINRNEANDDENIPPEQQPRDLQATLGEVNYARTQALNLLEQLQAGILLEEEEIEEILEDIDTVVRGQITITLVEDPIIASDNLIYSREALTEWARVRGPEMRLPVGRQRQLDMNIAELPIYGPARQVYYLVEQINAVRQANAVAPNPQPQ